MPLQHSKLPSLPKVLRNRMLLKAVISLGRKTLSRYLFPRSRLNEQAINFFFFSFWLYQGELSLMISYWVPGMNVTQISARNSFSYMQQNTQSPVNCMINTFNYVKGDSEVLVWGTKMFLEPWLLYIPALMLNADCLCQSAFMAGRKKMGNTASSVLFIRTYSLMFHWPELEARSQPELWERLNLV